LPTTRFHDEIIVNSPLAQAILIFRGGANAKNRRFE